mmetsp:Transcript_519/g.1022  ORF Transcript_519/g.1022 Transcript_519/m.1022 type:complete len:514 (-) Transcript_519:40-1581(-)|eukprot:CAMPEP_0181306996 /NCGR_PEP_ID=MMETSP1101-20121128/10615_1 /TAXON_ID=46948 /ORGANISM="Rhodomonas abbreviata, Strain Caron Lab Isolate" /LENGTH=513 /DNA_ID=CAMNT_0023413125 /DNA_START=11 /DNA_END=1552 /DNA_ORIENTATION=-
MVQAASHRFGDAPRRRTANLIPVITTGLLAVAAVLAVVHLGSPAGNSPVELDREASEIQKLQQEKMKLEAQLTQTSQPMQNVVLKGKAQLPVALYLKSQGKHPAATYELHQQAAKPKVTDLVSEKKVLQQELAAAAKSSVGDPIVEGVLGSFKGDTGDGLLGELKDSTDNVMGSLAATMTSSEKLKMLTNEAKAMGDVSPKEALAQRVISIGKDLLKKQPSAHSAAPSHLRAVHTPVHEMHKKSKQDQAAARIAFKHAVLRESKRVPVHARAQMGSPATVEAAKKRVELLRRELAQAKKVENLEQSLSKAKSSLSTTESEVVSVAKRQQLVAKLAGAKGKFAKSQESAAQFLARREEEEREEEEEAAAKEEDCRFSGDCHAKGYVTGGIVVGTNENAGPDRYGQLGAGPQLLKGRVGDNVVGAGLLGATGVYEDDVLVPTRLSGVRSRDLMRDNKNPRVFKELDPKTRHELIHGSVLHDYGGRGGLGIADEQVPLQAVHASEYRARTQQLADA